MAKNPEDLRVVKTKRTLVCALEELAAEKDLEHITISEICSRASVSRAAFYAHFHDKYELVRYVFSRELESIALHEGTSTFTRFVEHALAKLRDNEFVCRHAMLGIFESETVIIIERVFSDYMRSQVEAEAWRLRVLSVPVETSISYCSHGLAGVATWWIRSGFKESEAHVARIMHTLLSGTFALDDECFT